MLPKLLNGNLFWAIAIICMQSDYDTEWVFVGEQIIFKLQMWEKFGEKRVGFNSPI